MIDYSVTTFGKALPKHRYHIDLNNKVFETTEPNLTLDFGCKDGWTFITGYCCTFITAGNCDFKTGYRKQYNDEHDSAPELIDRSTFNTGKDCTFKTGSGCTFKTLSGCKFDTNSGCTFNTGNECTFMLWQINTCKFKSRDSISIILDLNDNKHYVLTKELIDILKITNG